MTTRTIRVDIYYGHILVTVLNVQGFKNITKIPTCILQLKIVRSIGTVICYTGYWNGASKIEVCKRTLDKVTVISGKKKNICVMIIWRNVEYLKILKLKLRYSKLFDYAIIFSVKFFMRYCGTFLNTKGIINKMIF